MIQLANVTVAKRGLPLLQDFSLTLESHHHYVIRGANGAGKTTLLETIAGDLTPRDGLVHYSFVDDKLDWEERYRIRKDLIHFVPTHALHNLIGSSDLFYQQRYYSIGDRTLPRVRDYLGNSIINIREFEFPESLNIAGLLDLELTRLSNGQVRKTVILKQLLRTVPKVLLLDYPFEGLDAESRIALSELIDHLAMHHGIQIMITDHHHHLPHCVNTEIVLEKFKVRSVRSLSESIPVRVNHSPHPKPEIKPEPVVEMKDLEIRYGATSIIQNLNWSVNKGERWAVTGRNGSGKTTLFSLIYADHPQAYSEEVYLFGRRRGTGESIWDIKNRIGYLGPEQFHYLSFPLNSTVRDCIYKQQHVDNQQFENLISFFNAHELLGKMVVHLSSGELQLVLLIIFFLSKKELLLLDEPFQFLDPETKKKVNEYLRSFLDEASTLILITHYEGDLAEWTDHKLEL